MEEEASDEILKLLEIFGDEEPEVHISEFSGIVMISTALDSFKVVTEIRKKILDEPWSIRYCHRFIPIQENVGTTIEEITRAVQNNMCKIKPEESYRITIEKRGSDLSSKDIIDAVANIIHNKVSLEKFDWNVIIEVFGRTTGISVLKEQDIVSTLKTKRDSME